MAASKARPGPVKRYPITPLATLTGQSVHALLSAAGVSGSTAQQYRKLGITEAVADRLACSVGVVPYEVWPEILDDAIDERRARHNEGSAKAQRKRYRADPEWAEAKRSASRAYYEQNRASILKDRRRRYHEEDGAAVRRAQRAAESPEQRRARLDAQKARLAAQPPEVRAARAAKSAERNRRRRAEAKAAATGNL